jgi:hypothetical protein
MFLLGELHFAIAEIIGAMARRGYLGRSGGDCIATSARLSAGLREKLCAGYARPGYNGAEAAALLGLDEDYVRDLLRDEAEKTGRDLVVTPAALYRRALGLLTMSLDGEIHVPDDCAARLVELGAGELRLLAAETWAAACREDSPLVAGLARFLVALRELSGVYIPLGKVADHYGAMLAGSPWDLGSRGDFARKKAGVLRLRCPGGRRRVHLRVCTAPAAQVLALGRNTWAVQQSDPRAAQPSLDVFLPGAEGSLPEMPPAAGLKTN